VTLDALRPGTTADAAPRLPPLPALVGRRVLIVDDVVPVALSTARLLDLFGGVPSVVHSGADALARLAATDPIDLLILDLGLPDLDGREVLARARALRPALPVIVVSGLSQDGAPLGPRVGFLAKPFPLGRLLTAVEDALAAADDLPAP
jgi:CheY-like chemotaxis protein